MSDVIDPIKLLTDKGERQPPFLNNKLGPVICALLGFGSAIFVNFGMRKPLLAGIQTHLLFATIGGAAGAYYSKRREEYFAKHDAMLRHYIELHPEDFPPIQRKKYADVLEYWQPIR